MKIRGRAYRGAVDQPPRELVTTGRVDRIESYYAPGLPAFVQIMLDPASVPRAWRSTRHRPKASVRCPCRSPARRFPCLGGEAGIGKSALLDWSTGLASEMRVACVSGWPPTMVVRRQSSLLIE